MSPTPPSTWGLIEEYDVGSEYYDPEHIFHLKKSTIMKCLFNNNPEKRINNIPNVNDEYDEIIEDKDIEQVVGGYFLPGLFAPQKDQKFNGGLLYGEGFGIIKLQGNNSLTSRMRDNNGKIISIKKRIEESMKKHSKLRTSKQWIDNGWHKDRVSATKYFIIDEGWKDVSVEDKNLYSLLKRQDNLYMEELTSAGEEGIYLTLSCSNLNMTVVDEKSGAEDTIYIVPDILEEERLGGWVKLRKELIKKYDKVFEYHKNEWDKMCDTINWVVKEEIPCHSLAQYLDDTDGLDADEYMQGRDVVLKEKKGPITRSIKEYSKEVDEFIKNQIFIPRETIVEKDKGKGKGKGRGKKKTKKKKKIKSSSQKYNKRKTRAKKKKK